MTRPEMLEVSGAPCLGPLPRPGVETSSISGLPPGFAFANPGPILSKPERCMRFSGLGPLPRPEKSLYISPVCLPLLLRSKSRAQTPSSADSAESALPYLLLRSKSRSKYRRCLKFWGPRNFGHSGILGAKLQASPVHVNRALQSAVLQTGFATQNRSNPSLVALPQKRDFQTCFCNAKAGPIPEMSQLFGRERISGHSRNVVSKKLRHLGPPAAHSSARLPNRFRKAKSVQTVHFSSPKFCRILGPKINKIFENFPTVYDF